MLQDDPARRLQERARAPDSKPWGLLLLLMATTSIGPTTLNILVPALPQLSQRLNSDPATLQLTVSLFLVALAGAQLVMGPLSDRFGRRPVLIAGLGLTGSVSILAVVVATVESLILARMLQAVGASTGIVVGRAIIRDLFDRDRAASTLGLVATVMVAVPTLGPLIGGLLDTAFGWRAIFLFTAATSLAVMVWIALTLPETRHLNAPPPGTAPGFFRDLRDLAAQKIFWGCVLAGAFGSSTFFAFLGGGPHVVVSLMGRSSAEFGVWFALSSAGYMAGNFAASRLVVRHGTNPLIWWGIGLEVIGALLAVALAFVPDGGPIILFLPQAIIAFGNGLMMPGAIAGAVSVRPHAAGTAAGIMGCTQMGTGAACVQFAGVLLASSTSALPLAMMLAALTMALTLSFALLGSRR